MAESRNKLIRETFEMDRDVAFKTFRASHFDVPEIVAACPDPALRTVLRGFWQQDAEKRYPEYRERAERLSTKELLALRAELQGVLAPDRFKPLVNNQPEGGGATAAPVHHDRKQGRCHAERSADS